MKKLLTILFFSLLTLMALQIPQVCLAQTGSWIPPGAQLLHPRTIVSINDLPVVRDSLASPVRLSIYSALYNQSLLAAPTNNSSSINRRSRAEHAKNAAFVALVNRMPSAGSISVLPANQFTQITTKSRTLLKNINTNVEQVFQYTEWQWRSKELIDYLIAYDLLRGAGFPADSLVDEKTKLQEFTANLYANATSSTLFYGLAKNNHALMTSAALGMAAVVLNDATSTNPNAQPQNWINTAMYTIDNVLWRDAQRQSDPNAIAGYAEGPYYFKYAFLNLLPFFKGMGNFLPGTSLPYTYNNDTRTILNPYYDPTYDLLYTWISAITMPDGRLPALEDSYINMSMPELVLTGKSEFVKPLWLQNFAPNQGNSLASQLNSTVDMRAAWLGSLVQPTPHADTLVYLPESGNLIFRNRTDHLSGYLHLYGKHGEALTNSGGHNQGDAGSFLLYSHGQLLALDPGYLSYDQRAILGNAANHNLLLVDGAGPQIGAVGVANDADAYIQNGFSLPGLQYGEVATAYQGADILRRAVAVRGKYYALADQISANQPHEYTWQLHGYGVENGTSGTGIFSADFSNKKGSWQKNGVSLEAMVTTTAQAPTYSADSALHELIYNTTESHSVMRVKQTGTEAGFLAILQPYTSAALPLVNNLQQNTAITGVTDGVFTDLFIVKADSALQTLQAPATGVQTNGLFTYLSRTTDGNVNHGLLQNGTLLMLDNQTQASASTPTTLAWVLADSVTIKGFVTSAAYVQLNTPGFPALVTGNSVSSWGYQTGTQNTHINFTGAGYFQISLSDTLVVGTPANLTFNVLVYPNPFTNKFVVIADGFTSNENVQVEITDLTGRSVFSGLARTENGLLHTEICPSQLLARGLYVLKLQSDSGKTAMQKIMAQ